jgi:hypothetical protein
MLMLAGRPRRKFWFKRLWEQAQANGQTRTEVKARNLDFPERRA